MLYWAGSYRERASHTSKAARIMLEIARGLKEPKEGCALPRPQCLAGSGRSVPMAQVSAAFPLPLEEQRAAHILPKAGSQLCPMSRPTFAQHLGTPVTVHNHSRLSDRLPARFQPWHGHVTTPAGLLKGFGAAHTLTPYPPGSPVPECLCSSPQDGQQAPQPQLTSSTLPPTSKSCFLTTHQ